MRAWRASLILGPYNGAGLRCDHGRAAASSYTVKAKPHCQSSEAHWLANTIIYSNLHVINEPLTQLIAC